MVHTISQETFDNAVRENMEEFEMDTSEAIKDTIKQFETQGVDLTNVIVDLMAIKIEAKPMSEAIVNLNSYLKNEANIGSCTDNLLVLKNECDKGVQQRVLAGREGAYNVLINLLERHKNDEDVLRECLKALTSLMTKQPDLLDSKGVETIMNIIRTEKREEVLVQLLKWVKECCVLHELNRQSIFDAGIVNELKPLLENSGSGLLCSVLAVLRSLVLDDDIRVEFGKAHEHARIIAEDSLGPIINLLEKLHGDEKVMNELMLTLSSLLVRTDFCKRVLDTGGIPLIQRALTEFSDNVKIVRQSFKVLKALAGNDECKAVIIQNGAAPIIIECIEKHKDSQQTAVVGLACISALTLRNTTNSKAFFEAGAPKLLTDVMSIHAENESVQKNASWSIRNMVSRSRYQNEEFIKYGVESLLHNALKKFKNIEYDVKAALRDLELEVNLKEEWTGKGGKLTTEENAD